jgi:hypothetical protein
MGPMKKHCIYTYLHHQWRNSPFLTIAFLRRFCQIASGFRFGFHNNIFFTEQGRQPCVQPQIWKARSLYLGPPVTGWPSYTPRHQVFLFVTFYDSRGYSGGILTCLHTWKTINWTCYRLQKEQNNGLSIKSKLLQQTQVGDAPCEVKEFYGIKKF